ncbi:type II toxin-antitoxin system RelE/ParE family toxin [Pseudonocardia hispaniensis]|uniref:Type II toxin-antitoxin system RelE/ParE family toxin n=1 Tax=Pseudonocardia hispaniensis TaxID=904933 RepID=A0ABW1IZI3_9PSEU
MRILFAFDPWRSSVLLVAGDKAGRWTEWYRQAIPRAEQLYETYLKDAQLRSAGHEHRSVVGDPW